VVSSIAPLSPLTVEFTGADLTANGTPMTGSYSIAAPGGTWDSGDNGTYTITLQDASVADTLGNVTSETVLGTFTVNISNLTPGMLVVTPAGDLSASGNVGGPFSPASLQYTLNNTGQTSLNWTAGKTAAWVGLSATSGTLAAGASTTVTVSFAAAANSLVAGSYNDTVSFSNTTNNNGNTTRGVSLTVVGAGVLAVTPAGGLSSSGTYGGPFSPASLQYTLNNTGGASINWTASKTAAWVGLSTASGTLAAGASTTVTVSINSTANTLNKANYSDIVSFSNTTNSNGNTTRGVALTVNAIPVTVTLGNLNQTYNGSPKPVTVTTNPTPVTYSVTYAGSPTVPTNANTYAVVATVTQANYSGSASGSLVIAKASQTITFDALASVNDEAASFALGATASSGLTVSYASSNTSVATVSGNMVALVGAGNTTITASQAGGTNYNAATDVPQTLTVTRANPLADPGGSYKVLLNQSLSLNGSASLPSGVATITAYDWDLNNDGTFGDVTGATPAAISYAVLTTTWGMVQGANTIQLRVTDSAAKTSTVSTTVNLALGLTWDANGTGAGQTNGGGVWLGANQWWDGSANTTWVSGSNADFGGPSTNGGAVTLASPTSVGSITFNTFTSTYTLGTAGQALTVSGDITNNSASGAATIISPLTLGAAQTWKNDSSGLLKASGGLDNGGNLLTFDGAGNFDFSGTANLITGAGGITMNGAGRLVLGAGGTIPAHNYSGTTTINNGVVMISSGNMGSGNLTLNGGVIETYWSTNFTRALGGSAGQMQLTGGASGFSMNGSSGASVIINNDAAFEVVWGSTFFKPSTLVLQASSAQNSSALNFQNKIDLNGATRTIYSSITTGSGAGSATISGVIRNSAGTAGITKTGTGLLILSATNTYNGNTTVSQGTLRLNAINANNEASTVTIASGATLDLSFTGTDTVGKLFIGATEQPAGVYKAVGSAATGTELAQITGTGTLTVTGPGDTTPPTLASSGIVDNKGGAPIAVSTLVTYTVTFSEDMNATTVTAAAFGNAGSSTISIGTITETSPTSGVFTVLVTPTSAGSLQLKVNAGAVLKDAAGNNLNTTTAIADNTTITVQSAYTSWAGGSGFNTDSNSDGIANGIAWVVGASDTSANAASLLPTSDSTADVNYLTYTYRRIDAANLDPNTTITVEYGSNLSGWSPATNDGTDTIITTTDDFYGAGIDKVEVKINKSLAQNGKLFSRLKVLQSSP
jgi:autotransporter-associated beta strand protein